MVVMVARPPESVAGKCKDQQRRFTKALAALNELASRATTVAIACSFGEGPDDRATARMADQAVKTYSAVVRFKAETTGDCTRRSPEPALDAVSRWVGERLGYMYAVCSSEAEQLVQQGLNEEQRRAKMNPSVQKYIEDILKRAGIPVARE